MDLLPRIATEIMAATGIAGARGVGYSPRFIDSLEALVDACAEATDALALQIHPELVWEALVVRLARWHRIAAAKD